MKPMTEMEFAAFEYDCKLLELRLEDDVHMRDRGNTIGIDAQVFYSAAASLIEDAKFLTPIAARTVIKTCHEVIAALEAKPGMRT